VVLNRANAHITDQPATKRTSSVATRYIRSHSQLFELTEGPCRSWLRNRTHLSLYTKAVISRVLLRDAHRRHGISRQDALRVLYPESHVVRGIADETGKIGPRADMGERRSDIAVGACNLWESWQPPQPYFPIRSGPPPGFFSALNALGRWSFLGRAQSALTPTRGSSRVSDCVSRSHRLAVHFILKIGDVAAGRSEARSA
jgi:hypothetical protein